MKFAGCYIAVLTICALCHNAFSKSVSVKKAEDEKEREKRIEPLTISLIASAVAAGASLVASSVGAAMGTGGYSIQMGMEVENWTKWILVEARARNKYGHISTPPRSVLPGEKEMMVAHKTGNVAKGCGGVLSFYIREIRKSVYIMWSIPYSHTWYANWMAVGIDQKYKAYTFDQMYYKKGSFKRAKYWSSVPMIKYSAHGLNIEGNFGTSYKPKAHIRVYPNSVSNLAPNMKKALNKGRGKK